MLCVVQAFCKHSFSIAFQSASSNINKIKRNKRRGKRPTLHAYRACKYDLHLHPFFGSFFASDAA